MISVTKSTNLNLTTGNLLKKLIAFSLPLILTSLLQAFYTTADLITVSNFGGGTSSMGSIGATNAIINLILGTFIGVTSGVNVVIANAKGEDHREKCMKAVHASFLICLILGVVVLIVGITLSSQILEWCQVDKDLKDNSLIYLRMYLVGAPIMLLYNCASAVLRAFGDSKRPFYALLISGVFNIGLNLILVIFAQLDVLGVAIATILSEFISLVLLLLFLFKDKRNYVNLHWKEFKLYKNESKEILRIGLLAGLQSLIFNTVNVFISGATNLLGKSATEGVAAASNIENYQYLIIDGIAVSSMAMVAQNYGAKKYNNCKKTLKLAVLMITISGLLIGGLIVLLSRPLLNLMVKIDDPKINYEEVYVMGQKRLCIMSVTYFACGIMDSFSSYYRGLKYALMPTIVTFIGVFVLRMVFVLALFNLDVWKFRSIEWLVSTFPLSWGITTAIYSFLYPKYTKKAFAQN